MDCHLFSANPLLEPMLAYGDLDDLQQISVKFESKYNNFHKIKMHFKMSSAKWLPILGLNVLIKGNWTN